MNSRLKKLTFTALFAAINYVAFAYGKINITIATGGSTAIHIANAVVVLSAWLLGPVYGGIAGAIGLSIADVLDPRYITTAPKTFILKLCIGLIAGFTARKMKLEEKTEKKDIIKTTFISAIMALGFNVIAEPVVGYFYKRYLLHMNAEASAIFATWSGGITALNAVICTIIAVLLYLSLHKSFKTITN